MSTLSFAGPRFTTKNLTLAAMLVALQVILNKLSIGDPAVLKFSFGFIATALIGYCLGPWIGGWSMVVSDIISNTILNSGSLFFPGFTLFYLWCNCRNVPIPTTDKLATNFNI